jgi:thiosulfate dehydrogenase
MRRERLGVKGWSFHRTAAAVVAGGLLLLGFGLIENRNTQAQGPPTTGPEGTMIPAVSWNPPDPSTIPPGKLGDCIRRGRNIIIDTPQYASRYVGDKMKCADCHLKEGTLSYASPLAGLTTVFPAFTKRDGRVISIEQRIQECFERSENGTAPPAGSPEMVAVVAYMNWLSKGIPMGSTVKGRGLLHLSAPAHADPTAGAKIYTQQCAVCHGTNGAGIAGTFPALWGSDSFNDGAGMSRVEKMAAFVKANMPKIKPGSLTTQQAYDVAAFVTTKPRPHFQPPNSAPR